MRAPSRRGRFRVIGLLVAVGLMLSGGMSGATAAGDPLQDRIDDVIATHGGVQTAPNEVSWNDGDVVLTLASPEKGAGATAALGGVITYGCFAGTYCAYSGYSYAGDRLTFTTCVASSPLLFAARSVYNNRSDKTIRVYKNTTLLATATAFSGKPSIGSGANKITCS